MEINSISTANNTSFGMALRRPSAEYIDRFVKVTGVDKGDFISGLRKRGLKQVQKELSSCKNFDVAYKVDDEGKDVFQVIDNAKNTVVADYRKGQSGLVKPSFYTSGLNDDLEKLDKDVDYKSIKFWINLTKTMGKLAAECTKIFVTSPKETLPKALLTAAEHAKTLEKDLAEQASKRIAHNRAINDVNNMFE